MKKNKKKNTISKTISIDNQVSTKIEKLRKENKRSYSAQVSFMLQKYIELTESIIMEEVVNEENKT